MSKRTSAGRILKAASIGYGAAIVLGGIALAEASLRFQRLPLGDVDDRRERLRLKFQASLEDVTLNAADGAVLKAWFIQPAKPNGKSVIILHGITSNRAGAGGYADMFLKRGYTVLIPDSRQHGESGGEIVTYGVLERHDVNLWVAWLRQRVPGCTFLLGESMGAAIGLQTAAITPDLTAIAVEAPYANFRQISYERLGRQTKLGSIFWQTLGRPILEAAIAYTHLRYGVYLPDSDPKFAVQHATTPTLLIAGARDEEIPMHHSEELQTACGGHCALWVVPNAKHSDALDVAPEEFENRIIDWFDTHATHPAA